MKPFLKWAGGKTQLIAEIEQNLPPLVLSGKFNYVEPFVGSGAVLFWMLNNFSNMKRVIINDINSDLINAYKIIASEPKQVISILKDFQYQYHDIQNKEAEQKEYYYEKRELYNTRNTDKVTQAALFIFLNRTCFNGLYRVNKSNLFNVPMGSYKSPRICDEHNILAVSEALQMVEILNVDFEKTLSYANENSFFYLDPPYKPLSATSNFNSYAENIFDDMEQIRLKDFCVKQDSRGSKWLLSNSYIQDNDFFDVIYNDFFINQVKAKRIINSKPEKRGSLNELLISNYKGSKGFLFSA
jgi:DNA adenine methylase